MGLINTFYSSWDNILYFLFTNINKYTHVYWSLLSLRSSEQHLCSWPCTKGKNKQLKCEISTCHFYNTTNILKMLESCVCTGIYPTTHSYMGISMSENKFSIKVPRHLPSCAKAPERCYLLSYIYTSFKTRHETVVKYPSLGQEQESKLVLYSFVAINK